MAAILISCGEGGRGKRGREGKEREGKGRGLSLVPFIFDRVRLGMHASLSPYGGLKNTQNKANF